MNKVTTVVTQKSLVARKATTARKPRAKKLTPAAVLAKNGADLPIPENKHVGRYFGRRVTDFQNWCLAENAKWKLTDPALVALWCAEHPKSTGRIDLGIVSGVRRLYNKGVHGQAGRVPEEASVRYGRDGEANPARAVRESAS